MTYRIPTVVPAAFAAEESRMVAAILPQEKQAWFFKIVGRQSAVELAADDFRKFVEEIRFENGQPVIGELPPGWKRGGNRAMRFASIDINTPSQQLDLSISQLARMEDWDALVTSNIVRWRKQVGLEATDEKWSGAEPLDWKDEAASTPEGEPDSAAAVYLDVTGSPPATQTPGTTEAPFASMMSGARSEGPPGDPHAGLPRTMQEAIAAKSSEAKSGEAKSGEATTAATTGDVAKTADGVEPADANGSASNPASPDSQASSEDPTAKLKFDRPEGWRDGRMSMMRLAAFDVGPEKQTAEVTIINAGGDLRGNVARWMGQIRESAVPEEEVDAALQAAEKFEISGRPAQRFVLLPPEKTVASDEKSEETSDEKSDEKSDEEPKQTGIDATIVTLQEGFSMFIKMTGPVETIRSQSDQMKQFLDSIRF